MDGLNSAIASGLVCHKLNRLGAEETLPVRLSIPKAKHMILPEQKPMSGTSFMLDCSSGM